MKKSTMRVLSLVMALMMIVGTLAVVPFSADAINQQPAQTAGQHKHTKGEFVDTVLPTCGLYGYSVYKCADEDCGIAFITDITEKLEHDWEEVGEVLATCDAKGHDAYYLCKNCGAKTLDPDTAVLLADDAEELNRPEKHDTAESYKINDPDDCTKGVYYVKYCKKCGKILNDNVLGTPLTAAAVYHNLYAEVTVDPTCQATGLATILCKDCGFKLEDVIVDKLSHVRVADKKENWKTIPATFLDREINYLPCKLCGEVILNEKGKFDSVDSNNNAYVNNELVAKIGDNIAGLLNIDLAGDWDQLEPGKSKTYTEEFEGETITFTLTKPDCEHKYNETPTYYGFEYVDGSDKKEEKLVVNQNTTFDDIEKFLNRYMSYVDVSDLYAAYVCKDETKNGLPSNNEKLPDDCNVFKGLKVDCEKTNKVVLIKAVGHQYADYTFEFKYDFNPKATDDSSLVSYFHTFTGGKQEVVYECGAKAKSTITCSICKKTIEKQVGNTMNHKFVTVCQNEECKENKAYDINFGTDRDPEYVYECTNCTHARKSVCFNLKGTKTALNDDRTYCLACDDAGTVKAYNDVAFAVGQHDFDEDNSDPVYVEATCTSYAYQAYQCKNCGQLGDKIPGSEEKENGYNAENHDWTIKAGTKVVTTVKPTCTTPGKAYVICNRFSCNAHSEPIDLPIDPDAHNLRAPDDQVYTQADADDGKIPAGRKVGDPKPDSVGATCTNKVMEKWFCPICESVVYITVDENSKVAADVHKDKDGNSTIETVKAKDQTCTSNGNYAYEYCTACGVITGIDLNDDGDFADPGETPEQGKTWTVEKDIDKTVRPIPQRTYVGTPLVNVDDNPLTFTERQWKNAYAGDTNIEYEVVKLATGDTMFYRITSGGTGHKMTGTDKVEATCYKDGSEARYACACGYKDPVRNGANIAKLGHPGAVEIVRPDDEDLIKTGTVVVKSTELAKIAVWTLRGAKEIDRKDQNGYQDITYQYEYVEATCSEEGYIIGKYCPVCMGTKKDKDNKDIPDDIYSVGDPAGYRIEKLAHAFVEGNDGNFYKFTKVAAAPTKCGADTYGYQIYTCKLCKEEYKVTNFVPAAHKEHKADVYKKSNNKLGQVKDEDIVYSIAVIGGKYVAISLGEDGKYYKYADATADNKGEYHIGALSTTDVYEYVECTDTIYTGKLCIYCGQFFCEDSEELEVEIAPKAHKDKDGNDIGITCATYDVEQAGAKCEICGKTLPKIVVLDDEKNPGLSTITYYTAGGALLGKGQYLNNADYFEVAHNWAVPQNDCEAINADIITCADCKISIKNTDAAPANKMVHQYLTKTQTSGKFETTAAWDNEENIDKGFTYFDKFIFFDVTYPTYLTEGTGVIYCETCQKEHKVVLNVVGAKATAEFDAEEPVIVGDVVSATISVSAKDFEFNTLEFAVTIPEKIAKRIALVDAELVYEFDDIDAVTASVTADGNVVVRTPGVANRNVAVNGDKVPFLKLYFKTGDITAAKEITNVTIVTEKETKIVNEQEVEVDVDNSYPITVKFVANTVIDEKGVGVAGKAFDLDVKLKDLEVYNPAYTVSAVSVLSQIYSTDYAVMYDFNRDGRVDLDDYFAMVDFVDSAKTIADFCTLTGYDVESMLETIDYDKYSSGKVVTFDPNNKNEVGYAAGTAEDKAYGKAVIRKALASNGYKSSIIDKNTSIAEFAQNLVDPKA